MAYFSHSTVTLALSLLCISENAHALSAKIDAYHDNIKSQVILVRNGKSFCGGTIISDRLVLTASQCIVDVQAGQLQLTPIFVFAFIVNRVRGGHQEKRIIREVRNIHVYGKNGQPLIESNIAILKLTEGFGAKSGVRWLPLPPRGDMGQNYRAKVFGFSTNVSTYPMDANMQDVDVFSEGGCYQVTGNRFGTKRICDSFRSSLTECYDIRGSGLVANGAVIGVASHQVPCVVGGDSWAIYPKVRVFTDWILRIASYKN